MMEVENSCLISRRQMNSFRTVKLSACGNIADPNNRYNEKNSGRSVGNNSHLADGDKDPQLKMEFETFLR